MPDPSPVHLMHQVVTAAERGQPPPPEAAAWLAGWWRTWVARAEAGRPISMEAAAGLGARHRPNWPKRQAREERNAALRELHRARFPMLEPAAAARAIVALALPEFRNVAQKQVSNILRK